MKRGAFLTVVLTLLLCCMGCDKEQRDIKSKIQKAELGTVEYTVRQIIRNSDETWKFFGERKVLFSVKATLKAGIDLDKLEDDDVVVRGKSIKLTLPEPQIMALNIRPDDIELVYSKVSSLRSNYMQKEYDEILRAGEEAIRNDESLRANILADAEANARDFFDLLLRSSGFENNEILFDE